MIPIELNESNFNGKTLKHKKIQDLNVLFIYANWCGHCRQFKPIYQKTASVVGNVVGIFQLDSDKSENVLREFNVRSFPSIYIFDGKGKKISEYTGPRDNPDVFISQICKMTLKCPRIT